MVRGDCGCIILQIDVKICTFRPHDDGAAIDTKGNSLIRTSQSNDRVYDVALRLSGSIGVLPIVSHVLTSANPYIVGKA